MWGAACIGIGLYGFSWGLRCYQRKRLLQNTPMSKVEAVALGIVELYGRAAPHEPMTSPIEQLPCVYWRHKVEELRSTGKSTQWVTIDSAESHVPFYLEDETGKILVVPDGATIEIPTHLQVESSNLPLGGDLSFHVFAFAQQKGIDLDGVFTRKKKFTEWIIVPGDTLFVFGPVIAKDDDHVTEAKTGGRLVCQDGSCPFFFISNRSARDVETEFEWKAVGAVIGGGLLAVLGLGMLLDFFHLL